MEATRTDSPQTARHPAPEARSLPIIRSTAGGILMGLANLVPGVSGGTMIVVVGLYDEFITSMADLTRFRFTRRNLTFLAILAGAALAAIAMLAGTMSRAVSLHRSAMYALFIGMTLGGAPLLIRMLPRWTASATCGSAAGLALMLAIAVTKDEPPNREAVEAAVVEGRFVVEPSYPHDVVAGVLGMSAMILPGVSGAYMLLILGRYETILASISQAKSYTFALGREGDLGFLHVLVPTAIGALVSLVCLSNVLKWMLHRHRGLTIGLLLGILFGSVVGIWPFHGVTTVAEYLIGAALAVAGFGATVLLSRIGA